MTFGEKLLALRKKQGWTQEELAGRITVSRQALSKWEQGLAVPDTENVLELARLFGVSTDYLLREELTEPTAPEGPQTPAPPARQTWAKPAGAVLAVLGGLGLLILGVLSSVFPCNVEIAEAGAAGGRYYTGLRAYLMTYDLGWLFWLCLGTLAGGLLLVSGLFHKLWTKKK